MRFLTPRTPPHLESRIPNLKKPLLCSPLHHREKDLALFVWNY